MSTPIAIASYSDPLSAIGSLLHPTQEMVNEVSEALAKAEAFPPPYKPYITPDYTAHPWMPRMTLHTSALAKWRSRVSRVPGKQDISFQMWLRHHFRFLFTADLCHAWDPFGGLAAQLSQVAVILSLASTENCSYAMIYHKELVRFLADSARARIPLDFRNYLSEVKEDIRKLIPRDAYMGTTTPRSNPARTLRFQQGNTLAQQSKANAPPPRPRKGKGKGKGKNKTKTQEAPAVVPNTPSVGGA